MNISAWLLNVKRRYSKWTRGEPPSQLGCRDELFKGIKPRVFLMNPNRLWEAKVGLAAGDPLFKRDFDALLKRAHSMLSRDAFSIMGKKVAPASGDKHDYFSTGQYWWPNPNSPDGSPFIRKDGQANPGSNLISDRSTLREMIRAVYTLGLAYFL